MLHGSWASSALPRRNADRSPRRLRTLVHSHAALARVMDLHSQGMGISPVAAHVCRKSRRSLVVPLSRSAHLSHSRSAHRRNTSPWHGYFEKWCGILSPTPFRRLSPTTRSKCAAGNPLCRATTTYRPGVQGVLNEWIPVIKQWFYVTLAYSIIGFCGVNSARVLRLRSSAIADPVHLQAVGAITSFLRAFSVLYRRSE